MQPFDFLILILIIASSIALLIVLRTLALAYFGSHKRTTKQTRQIKLTQETTDLLWHPYGASAKRQPAPSPLSRQHANIQ